MAGGALLFWIALTAVGSGTGLMTSPGLGLALYLSTITRPMARKARDLVATKHALFSG